jgi:hypothetical protein
LTRPDLLSTIDGVKPNRFSFQDFSDYKTSAYALIAANALPFFGVLFLGWDAFSIVVLYWTENVVIGAINVLKMLTCSPDANHLVWGDVDPSDKLNRERMERSRGDSVRMLRFAQQASKLFYVPFFIVHYGMFCLVHGVFIFAIFGREAGGFGEFGGLANFRQVFSEQHLWWAVAALAGSHLWSFAVNYIGRGEYRRTPILTLMGQPYGRIVILHVAILIGGFIAMALGSNVFVLLLLVLGKTLLDLSLHLAQRAADPVKPNEYPPVLPDVITNGTAGSLSTPATTVQSHPPARSSSGD